MTHRGNLPPANLFPLWVPHHSGLGRSVQWREFRSRWCVYCHYCFKRIQTTRTKSRGRVEVVEGGGIGWGGVGGWGENEDNCN